LALGISSLVVGVPTAVGGVAVTLVGLVRVLFTSSSSPPGSGAQTEAMVLGGLGMIVGGVVLAAVGGSIGLRKTGHNRVHLRKSDFAEAESAPVKLTGIGLAPTPGGAMVGATFAF
jgi:hypothetical protein